MKALATPFAALLLAACGPAGEPDTGDPAPAQPTPGDTTAPTPTLPGGGNSIPITLQGRWGLTSVDCEPGRPDAEGLLTITGERLEFYESVGALGSVREVEPERIHATFSFTGEGMSWQRDMELELANGGSELVRREYGADAAPGSIRYTRCN